MEIHQIRHVIFETTSLKSLKCLVPFVQTIQRLTSKSTEELYFMTQKSYAKFEEKLTYGLENDMRNLENFHQNT